MIRRITLENFMSHVHTVIEPAAGLTVIVGPNNCGKSAIVAALQCLSYGAYGKPFVRHGCRYAKVTVDTGEGDRIEWTRDNDQVTYTINGVKTHRGVVPDDLPKLLKINKVKADDDESEFDIHFAEQKQPIFLLGKAKDAALFFASSSDAGYLLRMQQNWKNRIRDRRSEANRLNESLIADRVRYEGYAPLTDIEPAMKEIEAHYAELADIERRRTLLQGFLKRRLETVQSAERQHAAADALKDLPGVPALADEESCRKVVSQWRSLRRSVMREELLGQSLEIAAPPSLIDTTGLSQLVRDTQRKRLYVAKVGAKADVVQALDDPPTLTDTSVLARAIHAFRTAQRVVDQAQQKLSEDRAALEEAAGDLREYVSRHPECPTCGGAIDPERFLNRQEHTHA
ncbi:MAG: AAA family ATPase [Methanoregulaceae archaeon]|nr:AAA family ATPase [Methanoregulaceae archaeon]